MTNASELDLVLRDARGGFFRLSMADLERYRVTDEESAELSEQFDGDTRGYFTLIELLDPPRGMYAANPDSQAILIGLLLPAVQKVR